jgi:hypothetical protein
VLVVNIMNICDMKSKILSRYLYLYVSYEHPYCVYTSFVIFCMSSLPLPDQVRDPPSLLPDGQWRQSSRIVEQYPSSADIKNEWSFIFTISYAFIVCSHLSTGTILLSP